MKNKLRFAAIYGIVLILASFIPFVGDRIIKSHKYTIEEVSSAIGWKEYLKGGRSMSGAIRVKGELFVSDRGTVVGGALKMPLSAIVSNDLLAKGGKSQLITHFQRSDFSKLEKYPEADFKIRSIQPNQITPGVYEASGDLTSLGKTKSIVFPVVITFLTNRVEVVGNASIDRREWGISCTDSIICNERTLIDLQFKLVAVKGKSNYLFM